MIGIFCSVFSGLLLMALNPQPPAWAQNVGDRVQLVDLAPGIPGHPKPGYPSVSYRFPGGVTVTITAIDAPTGWFQVEDDSGNSAWITESYIAQVITPETSAPAGLLKSLP